MSTSTKRRDDASQPLHYSDQPSTTDTPFAFYLLMGLLLVGLLYLLGLLLFL